MAITLGRSCAVVSVLEGGYGTWDDELGTYDRATLEATYGRMSDARSIDWDLVLKHVGPDGRPRQRHVALRKLGDVCRDDQHATCARRTCRAAAKRRRADSRAARRTRPMVPRAPQTAEWALASCCPHCHGHPRPAGWRR